MSDTLRPEVYVSPERLSVLQALATEGVRPVTVARTQEPVAADPPQATQTQEGVQIVKTIPVVGVPDSTNWESFMSCKGKTDLFFPPFKTENKARRLSREARAKAVCASCQVSQFCLEKALLGEEQGIWGGTNEDERRSIKSQRKNFLTGF